MCKKHTKSLYVKLNSVQVLAGTPRLVVRSLAQKTSEKSKISQISDKWRSRKQERKMSQSSLKTLEISLKPSISLQILPKNLKIL